jgi:hypothetical protein
MLLTTLPFDYPTLLEITDRRWRAPVTPTGIRVRRDAGRGKIR